MSKKIIGIFTLSLLVFLAGCTSADKDTNQNTNSDETTSTETQTASGLTALEAWVEVKPEVEKWDVDFKMARISDDSPASHQRIDGLNTGWKFYVEVCEEKSANSGTCLKGKSRSFYWYGEDMVGADKGVSATAATSFPSGRKAFDMDAITVDSDKAEELARQAAGQQKNKDEDFILTLQSTGEITYWQVNRQCWGLGGDDCDSQAGYVKYIDAETGEVYDSKPKTS